MERCGFLKHQRDGRFIYYTVAEPHLQDILKCVEKRFGEEITKLKHGARRSSPRRPTGKE